MCLIKSHRFPKIAWKLIKVYKVLVYFNKKLYTPFFWSSVKLNSTIKAHKKWYSNLDDYFVSGEGVHSYRNFKDARECRKYLNTCNIDRCYYIVESKIPRFSLYWEGMDINKSEIASTKLYLTDKKI